MLRRENGVERGESKEGIIERSESREREKGKMKWKTEREGFILPLVSVVSATCGPLLAIRSVDSDKSSTIHLAHIHVDFQSSLFIQLTLTMYDK